VEDNFDAARWPILLEADDGIDGADELLPEARDRNAGAFTQAVGYLRVV
jgi:hypothetical protein